MKIMAFLNKAMYIARQAELFSISVPYTKIFCQMLGLLFILYSYSKWFQQTRCFDEIPCLHIFISYHDCCAGEYELQSIR